MYNLLVKILLKNNYLSQDYSNYIINSRINIKANIKRKERYKVFIKLYIHHVIFRKNDYIFDFPIENYLTDRESIDSLVAKLLSFDIISFDIFDTLIFRPFEKPTDCFYLLEAENKLISFAQYRKEAEKEARENTTKPNSEINIFDIYNELQNYYDISDPHSMAEKEIELEKKICYANPYMLEVYNKLLEKGKKIIAVSDMYIPEEYIRQILNSCGYSKISEIFVSCDYGTSKTSGQLPELLKEKIGSDKNIIHIDDNQDCINGINSAGWNTYYYKQCNEIGAPHRMVYTNSPVSLMYKGIVNNYLHCGTYRLNPQEEIGFAYAGIAVCGYNEWLTDFCRKNNCDKILFLARDMDIFYKVYDQYYGEISHEYVQSSRNALRQLYFEQCPGDFFEYVIDLRLSLNKTIEDILDEADLTLLKSKCSFYNINLTDIFTNENRDLLKKLILDNKKEIVKSFDLGNEAAKKYFKEKIGNAKKICIAGLGWAGTEIVYLKWLIQNKWKFSVEVTGTLFGMDNKERSNMLNNNHSIVPFSFCNNNNIYLNFEATRNFMISHIIVEHIFSSSAPSLLKYTKNTESEIAFITNQNNPNAELIKSIQNGINMFVKEFLSKRKRFITYLPISGADSYEPLFHILDNYDYIQPTMGNFVEKPRAITGIDKNNDYIPLKELLKQEVL